MSKKPLVKNDMIMISATNTRKLRRYKNVHNKSILWHDRQNSHYRVVEWSAGCLDSYLSISNWKQWSSLLREYQTSPPGRINEFLTAGSAALHCNKSNTFFKYIVTLCCWGSGRARGVALIWKGKRWETLECLPTHVVQNAVKRIGSRQTKSTDNLKLQFHLFELSQSGSCLSPFTIFTLPIIHLVYHTNVCITVASNFSWVLRYLPNRKVYHGQCGYGELRFLVERRTFGNLLQQDWFRSLPRYDHRDVVGRPENSIKANDQHISPWHTRAFSTHPIS